LMARCVPALATGPPSCTPCWRCRGTAGGPGEDGGGALDSAQTAEGLSKGLQDKKGQAMALYAQIFPQILCEDYDTALERAEAARELFQDIGERRWDARTLWAACAAHARLEDYGTAVDKAKEARMIFDEVDDRRGLANALLVLSEMQEAGKDYDDALQTAVAAQEKCRALGHRRGQAAALQRQASVHLARDEPELAVQRALEAKVFYRGIEDRSGETVLLHMLAQVSLERGAKGAAELDKMGFPMDKANKQRRKNVRQSGREASKRSRQALGLSTLSCDKFQEGVSLLFLSQARLLNARMSSALKAASRAELIFAEYGDKVQEARAAVIVAQVHFFDPAKKEKAMELANKALELARRANDYQAEDAAIRILEDLINQEQKALPPPTASAAGPAMPEAGGGEQVGAASAAVLVPGLNPDDVRPKIFEVVRSVTGTDDEIHMDTPLMDTGMDSLSAVAFRNELNRMFQGSNLPASLMFDYPNINQITDHIVEVNSQRAG